MLEKDFRCYAKSWGRDDCDRSSASVLLVVLGHGSSTGSFASSTGHTHRLVLPPDRWRCLSRSAHARPQRSLNISICTELECCCVFTSVFTLAMTSMTLDPLTDRLD